MSSLPLDALSSRDLEAFGSAAADFERAVELISSYPSRLAENASSITLELTAAMDDLLSCLTVAAVEFRRAARATAAFRAQWLLKHHDELDSVEKSLRAGASLCDLWRYDDYAILESVARLLPLGASDTLPRLSLFNSFNPASIVAIANRVQCSARLCDGVVDPLATVWSGSGLDWCEPGVLEAALNHNLLNLVLMDSARDPLRRILPADVSVSLASGTGQLAAVVSQLDDNSLHISYRFDDDDDDGEGSSPKLGNICLVVNVLCGLFTLTSPNMQIGRPFKGEHVRTIRTPSSTGNAGLAVSPDGTLLAVSNEDFHSVSILRVCDGSMVSSFGSRGSSVGEFDSPTKLCFLPSRLIGPRSEPDSPAEFSLLVSDTCNRRLVEVTVSGAHVRQLPLAGRKPCGIAATADLIVVGTISSPQVFVMDVVSGDVIRSFGSSGREIGQLSNANGIRLSRDGRHVFLAEGATHRVSVFTIAGDFVCCTETWSTRLGYLEDVEVLDNGDVCLPVMSAEGNKVIVLSGMTLDDVSMNPDGAPPYSLWTFGGSGPAELSSPLSIARHRRHVYVLEWNSARIEVFQ